MHALIIGGARTGFGSFGGSLKDFEADELGCLVTKEALIRTGVKPEQVQEIFFGNVIQTGSAAIYLARHIGLKAGLPIASPALTVNRLCGSGMEAIVQAAMAVETGRADCLAAGGVEVMSQAPYISGAIRWGKKMGNIDMIDSLAAGLTDRYVGMAMGETAEKLSEIYKISREEQDDWALLSQKRAEDAQKSGRLREEIVPVEIKSRKGTVSFERDEFIKGEEGSAGLRTLPPVFKKDGTVTAANASGINDGASAVIVGSEKFARENGLKPLAKILGYASTGCAPDQMGIGPAHAIPVALKRAGLTLEQMDLIEINEAFAAQFLAVKKALSLDEKKTNVNGGAVAIGHPLGASGNRIALTLALELKKRDAKYGVASLCIGGGQGIAMVLERV